jgi:serine/threonine protein kinase
MISCSSRLDRSAVSRTLRSAVAVCTAVPSHIEALGARLIEQMNAACLAGQLFSADDLLSQHAELYDYDEVAVQILYEDYCLREEAGLEVDADAVVRRYPQWRAKLEVLFDCHRLVQTGQTATVFPQTGQQLGDFQLLAELGRGAMGRVFLARQGSLADRPVVLKLIPWDGHEHQSLARLQHDSIVPIMSSHDFPDRNLRALCMPYLGGMTISRLLELLQDKRPAVRTVHDLVQQLQQHQASSPIRLPSGTPALPFLTSRSYVFAVCWMGTRLAEALHCAHQRGLVHLDVKPSNVLMVGDGPPMLLDFHLAREPIEANAQAVDWLGGTSGYMSPEQQLAMAAVRQGRPVPLAVDGRSDVYSLGLLLYEMLAGSNPSSQDSLRGWADRMTQHIESYSNSFSNRQDEPRPLRKINSLVSPALERIIHKCLRHDPSDRYENAASLAKELSGLLGQLPSQSDIDRPAAATGARRPVSAGLVLAALAMFIIPAAAYTWQLHSAQKASIQAQRDLDKQAYEQAEEASQHGLQAIAWVPGRHDVEQTLRNQRQSARRALIARALHEVVEQLRQLDRADTLPAQSLRDNEAICREVWNRRLEIIGPDDADPTLDRRTQADLLDLAILGGNLHARLAPTGHTDDARREALRMLAGAEELFGPSTALYRAREVHAQALGLSEP